MFKYLINKQKFVISLGQFITYNVIHETLSDTSCRHVGRRLRTVEEINELDRIRLAYEFYESVYPHYLEGGISRVDMIEHIARYIDKRIPQTYVKWNSAVTIKCKYREHSISKSLRGIK
ncbi:hypothetical protein QRY07_11995 [Bacillus cereus]|uniref:hypothetical protein n=1 Tax=Bacillus cereus TaxID=1396 RepID=UPI0025704B8A|nr:hypothetical protein [Bacillus cereus]WJE22408.1 hypothetical protein QRY07_11995 [Bacillus cereus]